MYVCYLNGKFYGGGDLKYMHELFKDYVITSAMYGKEECDFKIIKVKETLDKIEGQQKEEININTNFRQIYRQLDGLQKQMDEANYEIKRLRNMPS